MEFNTGSNLSRLIFSNLDIGSPQLPGSIQQVESGWDVVAGGADIWEESDQFHYVHRQMTGDFDIAVRAASARFRNYAEAS